jgi:tRNA (cmo5U34)-methyltransferase
MTTDRHFTKPQNSQFEFNHAVVGVFDDMLSRSVPLYKENTELIADLIARFLGENGVVVDIGCSTGTMLAKVHKKSGGRLTLIGIDSSEAMIEAAKQKALAFGANIDFKCADAALLTFNDIDAVCASYLLQFIRPPKRDTFVRQIYKWLKKDAIFVFSEKLACEHKRLDKIMIDGYLDFKRLNGYSDYEISKKREALENVLIPYSDAENKEMIVKAGFSHIECILRWNNFATYIAIK